MQNSTSSASASNFTSPDLEESVASSSTEPLDWAEEVDRDEREKEQIDQAAAAVVAPEAWGGAATWPGWDDGDDEDEGDPYASMSVARGEDLPLPRLKTLHLRVLRVFLSDFCDDE